MIANVWIEGTQKIANFRINKDYPLMSENHFSKDDVKYIIESFLMLMEEYELSQTTRESI